VVETLAPNPIGFSSVEESRPSVADRTTATAPSGGGPRKKHIALGTKHKQDQALADQVTIELPPYHGPQSPLDLVVVDHIFRCLFEALRLASLAARTGTSAGEDIQPSKRAQALPLKKMLMPRYILILRYLIASPTLIIILTTWLFVGNPP
jgi:hypothetical protein